MSVNMKKKAVYLGMGLSRSAWCIFDDDVMVDYAFSEDEAVNKAMNLLEQKEHRDGG